MSSSASEEPTIRSYILSVPTHVTPRPEFQKHFFPVATLFIGPTNPKGHHPAVSLAAMCRILVFKKNFKELTNAVSRFMGKELPLIVIGRSTAVDSNDEYIPLFNNCRFIHREAGGYHVLCRIYPTDISGKEARIRLHKFADRLETPRVFEPVTPPSGRRDSRGLSFNLNSDKRRLPLDSDNEDDENTPENALRFD
ncbi:hypothetical protein CRE_19224 [Caenorhabditis remanei]|uniref:Uncharacterized protein n=1 Tax=Caenorhabditis remanei TaxID=31234 RepID=E3MJI8_CAERE|nr:hypothetical protein CRE_19224 [Caenorhabditis remanei]